MNITRQRHVCHAIGCKKEIPPRLFMCLRHWQMISRLNQQRIWENYRPGQEQDKHVTLAYVNVTRIAIRDVFRMEHPGEDYPDYLKD